MFLRLLIYIYKNQQYTVKWGQSFAPYFNVKNGVRQGGVSSGIFFVVYIDELLSILRNSGLGCTIRGVFYGAVIYADDIFLLSSSRNGLQAMINLSHDFASNLNLKFGTNANPEKSKTKCIMFARNRREKVQAKELVLDGHNLPWVSRVKHLGNTLQSENTMALDINAKRGAFIGKTNALLQEFYYATPEVLLKLINSYACHIYGSNLWDLFSSDCQKLFNSYNSYNVMLRNVFNLDRTTHRYVLETLTDIPHLYVQLLGRFVTFVKSLLANDAFEVRFLAN